MREKKKETEQELIINYDDGKDDLLPECLDYKGYRDEITGKVRNGSPLNRTKLSKRDMDEFFMGEN